MRALLPVPALAVLVLLAGCGGGGGGGGDRLSQADFVKQGNAICKDYNAKIEALGDPKDASEVRSFVDKAGGLVDEAMGKLDALSPPKKVEDDLAELITSSKKTKDAAQDLAKAVEDKDQKALAKVTETGDRLDKQSDALATKIGLTECAKN